MSTFPHTTHHPQYSCHTYKALSASMECWDCLKGIACVTVLQVQRCGEAEDLPDAESIRAYACTLPDALPLLQSELQPVCGRIGQASYAA